MSPNPASFLAHLNEFDYHPRSDKHSNALAEAIVADLTVYCPKIRERAARGELVYDLNFTLKAGTADWNVDLVLGTPPLGTQPPTAGITILCTSPSMVQIAIEIKAVMTEHHKAVKNRKRDLEAHHEHVHNYNAAAIAGGVLVINAAPTFKSPLRPSPTTHRSPAKLVQHCINELRAVAARGGPSPYGLDARCAIVVECDNISRGCSKYLTLSPAPQTGDPLSYDAFIQAICQQFTARF